MSKRFHTKESMLPQKELEKLVGEPDSGIFKVREEVHIAIQPKYLDNLTLGLLNHFNKQINTWHTGLKGILAGYGKLQLKRPTGQLINEQAHIHLDVLSDFWVFRPERGTMLKGVVTKKSASHVSCLVHGIFNVPCHKPASADANWATNIKLNGQVKLEVIRTDMSQKVPFILGSLISTECSVKRGSAGPVEILDEDKWEASKKTPAKKQRVKKVDINGINGNGDASLVSPIPLSALPMTPISPSLLPVTIPQEPAPITAMSRAKKKTKPAAAAPVVVQQTVLPPAINVNTLLSNLAPVKELEPKKKSKKRKSIPDNIAEVVNNVVNSDLPVVRSATMPPASLEKVPKTPVAPPIPVAKYTSTPIVSESLFGNHEDTSTKKKKKKKRLHHEEEVLDTPHILTQMEETSSPKKKKKKKDKRGEVEVELVALEASLTSSSPPTKKKKKYKKGDVEAEPVLESLTSSSSKKKKKKKRRDD